MGAQQLAFAVFVRIEKERVVHFARRMAGGKIQLGEIVIVDLDIRTFGDGKAHVSKDRGQFIHHLTDRMNAAGDGPALAHGQGDVHLLGGTGALPARLLQHMCGGW